MTEIEGLPARIRGKQVEVDIDRSRQCPGPHPSPDQLEALDDDLTRTITWMDDHGTVQSARVFNCPLCRGYGIIQPDIDVAEQRRLHAEPIPPGHPSLVQEQYTEGLGGSGR